MELSKHSRMPAVGAAMTPFPHFVRADDPIEQVEKLIAEHGIRHIPVQDDTGVVGLVSERDLFRARFAPGLHGACAPVRRPGGLGKDHDPRVFLSREGQGTLAHASGRRAAAEHDE